MPWARILAVCLDTVRKQDLISEIDVLEVHSHALIFAKHVSVPGLANTSRENLEPQRRNRKKKKKKRNRKFLKKNQLSTAKTKPIFRAELLLTIFLEEVE